MALPTVEINDIIAKLAVHQEEVATVRDRLDATIRELTELRENCDDAWNDLMSARDVLSRLV